MLQTKWGGTLLVSGGHFWVDFYVNMLPPLLPFIGILWGLNNTQLALAVTVQTITANFLQPVFGYLIDKAKWNWSLGLALAAIAIPMSLLAYVQNYPLFLFLVALGGLGSALYHPLGATKAVEGANSHKAIKMSVYSAGGNFGFAFAPAITALIVAKWGLNGLVYLVIPGLIWIMLLRLIPKSESEKIYEEPVYCANDGRNYRSLWMLSGIVGLRSWLVTATTTFIPLWLVAQGTDEKQAGLVLTYYLLAGTLGGFLCGYICPLLGKKKTLAVYFLLTLVVLPLYFYVSPPLRNWVLVILGLIIHGTGPVTVVIGQELLPERAGLASGMTMGFAFGLGGIGTSLTGMLADKMGYIPALLMTALLLIPALILTGFLKLSETSAVKKEEGVLL
ncbi:MFS transporter [Thermanaerosceptrum fracticalcis]|uniref:MFS transporter n=1 Tax=Thermanaerosceptrum fracticalcis TaxID=1712410 RepID=A0A7G6E151_THEFR|nr:MFS transporter [Thermanaerosceptrum fracticalcis]QNB45805.1 MFS transporter [Thermanaerosceptrum fracticalcis]